MLNLLFSTFVLALIVNTTYAVHFRVICAPFDYGGSGVTVYIDGVPYEMQSLNNDILYEFTYDGVPSQYYYEVTGVPTQNELALFGMARTWDPQSTTTLYEVFGRQYTVGDDLIQTIPRLYPPLEGYDKFSQLFQEGEIPVINVQISQTDYNQLINLVRNDDLKFKVEFDFYTPYEKYHFTDVTLSLSGQGSKTQEKKPYKFDLSEDETNKANTEIFGRKEFKLRSLRYDESGIKNKLASDIIESLGLPITQSAPCRLYMNNKSYGLYELSDLYKKKFVKRFFNPQKDSDNVVYYGSLYKGVSGEYPAFFYSDVGTTPVTSLYESIVAPTAGYDPHQDLLNMIQWLESLPETASRADIEKQFDVDMFLKFAIVEYLVCQWDGYIYSGNNFLTYIEPNNGIYHFFSYDLDLTFGKWCPVPDGTIDDYIAHLNDAKHQKYGPEPRRDPLLYTKIMKNPEIEPTLISMIQDIVQNLFNIEALGPRIEYFHKFLKDDLYWDVFCYNIIETQFFINADRQDVPEIKDIEAQYSEDASRQELRSYIKYKSQNVADTYGFSGFNSDARYGTVGGKLMTIGKASGDSVDTSSNLTASGSTAIEISTKLLVSLMSILLLWLIN